jgi:hypothetical protein
MNLPRDYPLAQAESIVDYAFTRIEQATHLLPAGGVSVTCLNGGACNRNVIQFRNYRKFGAESTIKFFRSGLNE